MEGLIKRGLLRGGTDAAEWFLPGHEDAPAPPDGYVVSFAPFHECGLAVPPHLFFRGLLHHYQIELQHLNPNRIQHIVAFYRHVRGVPGDRAPLRAMEIFLLYLLDHEEGERAGDPGADGMRGHPPLGAEGNLPLHSNIILALKPLLSLYYLFTRSSSVQYSHILHLAT